MPRADLLGERPRLLIQALVVLIAIVLVPLVALDQLEQRFQRSKVEDNAASRLSLNTGQFKQLLKNHIGHLFVAAKLPQLQDFARAPDRANRAEAERTMAVIVEETPDIAQLRFIDTRGTERLRIDRTVYGVTVVPTTQHQDKRDRYYFIDAMEMPDGGIFISRLDLNVEAGKVEEPWKPVLRIATPVSHDDGQRVGVVVMNVFAQPLIDVLSQLHFRGNEKTALLDQDGYWLSGAPKPQLWGFMFGTNARFAIHMPDLWKRMTTAVKGGGWNGGTYYAFETIDPELHLGLDSDRPVFSRQSWKVLHINYGGVSGFLSQHETRWALLGICALIVLAAWIWSGTRQQVLATRRLFDQLLDNSEAMISVKDPDGQYLMVNRRFAEVYGVEYELVAGSHPADFMPAEEAETVFSAHQRVMETGRSFKQELEIERNGRKSIYLATRFPLFNANGEIEAVGSIATGITSAKALETRLRTSEERFRKAFEDTSVGVIMRNINDRKLIANQAFCKMAGYTAEELERMRLREFTHPEDRARNLSLHNQLRTGKIPSYSCTRRLVRRDGEEIWVKSEMSTISDDHGKPIFTSTLFQDITELKRAELAAEQNSELLTKIFETVGHGLAIYDGDNNLVQFNSEFEKLFRFPRGFLKPGLNLREIVRYRLDHGLIDGDRVEDILSRIETKTLKHRSGERQLPDGTAYILDSQPLEGGGFVISYTDITDRRREEEHRVAIETKLHQTQKIEAIGTLAGGIAHDFNNTLTPIVGLTQLVIDDLAEDDPRKAILQRVLQAADRSRKLVRQILDFSRSDTLARKEVDLGSVMKDAVELLNSAIPSIIRIKSRIAQYPVAVVANETQMHQVVMNLATNAAAAIGAKGGVIKISLAEVELDSSFVHVHPDLTPGRWARISVEDTGCGMDDQVAARIFEPFFTTKDVDEGTGLGLATVHGIVTAYGGTILVSSEVGVGTKFDVYLPVADSVSWNGEQNNKSEVIETYACTSHTTDPSSGEPAEGRMRK